MLVNGVVVHVGQTYDVVYGGVARNIKIEELRPNLKTVVAYDKTRGGYRQFDVNKLQIVGS